MIRLKNILLLFFLAFFLPQCSKQGFLKNRYEDAYRQKIKIPDFIIARSDSFLVSKTGPAFFNNYVKYDSVLSFYHELDSVWIRNSNYSKSYWGRQYYHMVYNFKVSEKPWIYGQLYFDVDTSGNWITGSKTKGIPECLLNQNYCIFNIDSSMAISIAQQDGLEKGTEPWRAYFIWDYDPKNKYVWEVSNNLTKYSGKVIVLDPNSGTILRRTNWITEISN